VPLKSESLVRVSAQIGAASMCRADQEVTELPNRCRAARFRDQREILVGVISALRSETLCLANPDRNN